MKRFEFMEDYGENKKGDIVDYDEKTYHMVQHRLLMNGILKDTEKEFEKEKEDFDLNKDGKFDLEDASIAGKALAKQKKIRKVV